jgi:hypothetical protein
MAAPVLGKEDHAGEPDDHERQGDRRGGGCDPEPERDRQVVALAEAVRQRGWSGRQPREDGAGRAQPTTREPDHGASVTDRG